jgi:hypothetical protein
MQRPRPDQPKTRSHVALASWLRQGAGKHGGSARAKNRRARRATKQQLRKEHHDY